MIGPRVQRLLQVALIGVLVAVIAVETVQLYFIIDGQSAIGTDLDYYRFVADRWLDTGVYYTDQQLAGPYVVQTQVHNLYPPHALYLFVPFLFLPDFLWWALPLAFLGYVIWWCRPTPWTWVLLLGLLALPKGLAQVLFGNSDMWIAAFGAGAVRWSWPGVLVSIKPSLALFGLPGVLSRAWWLGAAGLVLISLPLWSYWLQWPVITQHSNAQLSYSFGNFPFFFLPIMAWLGSSKRGDIPFRRWVLALFGRRVVDQS